MKKNIITLAMAAVMTFAMSVTAFAAGSTTAPTYAPIVVVDTNSETDGVNATQTSLPVSMAETNVVLEKAAASKNATVEKITVIEISGTVPADGIVVVTAAGLGVKAGDSVMVQHYTAGAYKEESAEVVGDDKIKISGLTSFSPFVISVLKANPVAAAPAAAPAPAAAAPAATATTEAAPTSPKTGFSLEVIFAAIADLF